jgi:hypothetical protein
MEQIGRCIVLGTDGLEQGRPSPTADLTRQRVMA